VRLQQSVAALLVGMVVAACHQARPGAGAAVKPCRPVAGSLSRSASATTLAGEYRLHLAATSGVNQGQAADAALRLRPVADSAARDIVVLGVRDTSSRAALAGTTDLDPTSVGATRTGSLTAEGADAPGVLVIERRPPRADAGTEIMLRLGADANRRGVARYDGGYFALTVTAIEPDGFSGTWSSGSEVSSAKGYFCAERVGPKPND
jgi:hypothetical protein